MANRPFTAENTNIFKEAIYTSAPATLGTNNVLVTQALNRSVCDQNSTCIAGNLQPNTTAYYPYQYNSLQSHIQPMQASKQYIPGGVSFTFNPSAQNYALRNFSAIQHQPNPNQQQFYQNNPFCYPQPQQVQQTCQQPLSLEQQIALKQIERESLELMLLQEQLKKAPYKIRFHYNGQTSTTDLSKAPQNISGEMMDLRREIENIGATDKLPPDIPPSSLYPPVSKAKRLVLTKSPNLQNPQSSYEKQETGPNSNDVQKQEENLALTGQKQIVDQAVQTKQIRKKCNCRCRSRNRKKAQSDESTSTSSSSSEE